MGEAEHWEAWMGPWKFSSGEEPVRASARGPSGHSTPRPEGARAISCQAHAL